jgi:hypothetical protein
MKGHCRVWVILKIFIYDQSASPAVYTPFTLGSLAPAEVSKPAHPCEARKRHRPGGRFGRGYEVDRYVTVYPCVAPSNPEGISRGAGHVRIAAGTKPPGGHQERRPRPLQAWRARMGWTAKRAARAKTAMRRRARVRGWVGKENSNGRLERKYTLRLPRPSRGT